MLILTHPDGALLVKSYRLEGDAFVEIPVKFPKEFTFYQKEVSNLQSLAVVLSELESKSDSMVVSEIPIDGYQGETLSRSVTGSKPHLQVISQQWLCIDIDGLSVPEGNSTSAKDGPELAKYVAAMLPNEFQNVDFYYQFSSSMGIKSGIRLHLWYWLDRPISNDETKAWLSDPKYPVDLALYKPTQPIFTSSPVFDPPEYDPFTPRSGLLSWENENVEVPVPADLADRVLKRTRDNLRRTRNVRNDNIEDDRIIRDPVSGLVTDGREQLLFDKSVEAAQLLTKGLNSTAAYPNIDEISELTWHLFEQDADLSDQKWTKYDALEKARHRHERLIEGWSPNGKTETVSLIPDLDPYFDFQTVSVQQGMQDLDRLLVQYFSNATDKTTPSKNMALRVTMGAGKTTSTIKQLKIAFEKNPNLNVEFYLPRHDLIREILGKFSNFPNNVEIIHVRGRTETGADQEPTCQRADYVKSLEKSGLSIRPNACHRSENEKCEFYDDCSYFKQFRTNPLKTGSVRLFPHEYLSIPRMDTYPEPDMVLIDESFLSAIHKETRLSAAVLHKAFSKSKADEIFSWIWSTLEHSEPTLTKLREEGVGREWIESIDFEYLKIDTAFDGTSSSENKGPNGRGQYEYRFLEEFKTVLIEELEQEGRTKLSRIRYDPSKREIVINQVKLPNFQSSPSFLILDATADEALVSHLIGNIDFHRIDFCQQSFVTQVYDRTGSNQSWDDKETQVDELLSVLQEYSKVGVKVLCVSHKDLADQLREKIDNPSIGFAHFQALRGIDKFKDFNTIFITGRNQPPEVALDGIARAVWWNDSAELDHDIAADFNAEPHTRLPTDERGYLMTDPDIKAGVKVHSFRDRRIEIIHQQIREAETVQAIARLRLVHAKRPKSVFLLGNPPIEMPIDNLMSWAELMPNQAEIEFMEKGNIPLTPAGWLKMRPDIIKNEIQAKNLNTRSRLKDPQSLLNASPFLMRKSALIITFKKVVDGKPTGRKQAHLFRLNIESDDEVQYLATSSLQDQISYLENGDPEIIDSGWGSIEILDNDWL